MDTGTSYLFPKAPTQFSYRTASTEPDSAHHVWSDGLSSATSCEALPTILYLVVNKHDRFKDGTVYIETKDI
jgi:hypothetical protein